MISFCTFGYASSFGVYQDYYVLAGTSTSSNISWIGSLQLFMLFFVGFPAGRLFDAGYLHLLLFCGSILFVFWHVTSLPCFPSTLLLTLVPF